MKNLDLSRDFYRSYEAIHAGIYFLDAANQNYQAIGLTPGWMGYFASRSAPMGAISAKMVMATFYSFSSELIERYIPRAWTLASPDAITDARLASVSTLMEEPTKRFGISRVNKIIEQVEPIATSLKVGGRPLFAGHASQELSSKPEVRLWQLLTLFREHRGDSHVAILVSKNLTGIEANVLHHLDGRAPKQFLTKARGHSNENWDLAVDALAERGFCERDSSALTNEGKILKSTIEAETDTLSNTVPEALGTATNMLIKELSELSQLVRSVHGLTF